MGNFCPKVIKRMGNFCPKEIKYMGNFSPKVNQDIILVRRFLTLRRSTFPEFFRKNRKKVSWFHTWAPKEEREVMREKEIQQMRGNNVFNHTIRCPQMVGGHPLFIGFYTVVNLSKWLKYPSGHYTSVRQLTLDKMVICSFLFSKMMAF